MAIFRWAKSIRRCISPRARATRTSPSPPAQNAATRMAACPTSEGFTFGGVLSFLFGAALGLLAAYLLIGTLYNYFFLGLTGTDALPRFTVAGALHHGREAYALARDWAAGGRGGFNLSSSGNGARGPVGLGGPGGFSSRSSGATRDPETGGRAFGGGGAHSDTDGDEPGMDGKANANPFIRSGTSVRKEHLSQPQGGLNPASHQAQVMAGAPAPAATPNVHTTPNVHATTTGMPSTGLGLGGGVAAGLNPASHQAQVMSAPGGLSSPTAPAPSLAGGMPSPGLGGGLNPASHQAQVMAGTPMAPLTPGRQRFELGDDEGDADELEEEGVEIQVADVRGRMDTGGAGGEGIIRL
ncbi:hypothetical protein K438DRAFT_865192 [Mycena galopus ATCC 62051]|nr:hypothetical protein K438DRAFT_865192 [Mycena galopus ATCC 62051]